MKMSECDFSLSNIGNCFITKIYFNIPQNFLSSRDTREILKY